MTTEPMTIEEAARFCHLHGYRFFTTTSFWRLRIHLVARGGYRWSFGVEDENFTQDYLLEVMRDCDERKNVDPIEEKFTEVMP